VIVGTTPAFTEVTSGFNVLNDRVVFEIPNWEYGREYEIVLTDRVRFNGETVDATNSLIGRGVVSLIGQEVRNWYNSFNFQQKTTEEALRILRTSFPGIPTIHVRSWNKRCVEFPTNVLNRSSLDFKSIENGPLIINAYYQLKYQIPATGYQALRIYRRVIDRRAISKTTLSTTSPLGKYVVDRTGYGMVGAWEFLRITNYGSTDALGFYTLNLRSPIRGDYLNTDYEGPANQNALNPSQLIDPRNRSTDTTQYFPISLTFKSNGSGSTQPNTLEQQFFFVLEKNDGTLETNGKMLNSFGTSSQITDGFLQGGTTERIFAVSQFQAGGSSAYQAGYGRNLNEAIASPAINRLRITNSEGNFGSFVVQIPAPWPTSPTRFIQAPAGITIV
jgi:hypothetical protein